MPLRFAPMTNMPMPRPVKEADEAGFATGRAIDARRGRRAASPPCRLIGADHTDRDDIAPTRRRTLVYLPRHTGRYRRPRRYDRRRDVVSLPIYEARYAIIQGVIEEGAAALRRLHEPAMLAPALAGRALAAAEMPPASARPVAWLTDDAAASRLASRSITISRSPNSYSSYQLAPGFWRRRAESTWRLAHFERRPAGC